jgi:hypothetical protein
MAKGFGVAGVAAALSALLLAGSMTVAGAAVPRDDQPPVTIGDKDGYPQVNGKNQVGAPCAPKAGAVGGGLVVSGGGQAAAALVGTGVAGCGTFYGLQIAGAPPRIDAPDVEPVIYADPGQPSAPAPHGR